VRPRVTETRQRAALAGSPSIPAGAVAAALKTAAGGVRERSHDDRERNALRPDRSQQTGNTFIGDGSVTVKSGTNDYPQMRSARSAHFIGLSCMTMRFNTGEGRRFNPYSAHHQTPCLLRFVLTRLKFSNRQFQAERYGNMTQ